jgi:hypothetical protein
MTAAPTINQSTDTSRIPGNIAPRVLPLHPNDRPSPKLREIARILGCSEASAEKKLYGPHAVNVETAVILETLIRRGDTQDAAAFESPIRAAMMGEALPTIADAVNKHNACDAYEDVAQADFVKNSAGDAELDGWIKKLAHDIHNGEMLLACLEQERQRRREAK